MPLVRRSLREVALREAPEIREIEGHRRAMEEEGSMVDADTLVLEAGAELLEGVVREVGRQMALVARVDVDIFTEALLARTAGGWLGRLADVAAQRVFRFRLEPQ